jgi:hypothetical protein
VREDAALEPGFRLFTWIGDRHRRGVEVFRNLVSPSQPVVELPSLEAEPTDLISLDALSRLVDTRLAQD